MKRNMYYLKGDVNGFFKRKEFDMSSGPSGAEGSGEIVEKYHTFVHVGLKPETWCQYEGGPEACGFEQLATERDYACLYCKHRKPVDIPNRIAFALRSKELEK